MKVIFIVVFLTISNCMLAQYQLHASLDSDTVDETILYSEYYEKPFMIDTVTIKSYANNYNPRRSLLFAAILPGVGQMYNRKYWKVPIVWGGFAALSYIAFINHNNHVKYRDDLFSLLTAQIIDPMVDKSPLGFSDDVLRNAVNRFRRQRDFFIILNGFWYILQMVDAHVDSHLKEFKLNPELQVSVEPFLNNSPFIGSTIGLGLVVNY